MAIAKSLLIADNSAIMWLAHASHLRARMEQVEPRALTMAPLSKTTTPLTTEPAASSNDLAGEVRMQPVPAVGHRCAKSACLRVPTNTNAT